MDALAQRTLLGFRLALVSSPPQPASPDSAASAHALANGDEGVCGAPWLHRAGLMPGVSGAAIMWALQSGAQSALLDALLDAVSTTTTAHKSFLDRKLCMPCMLDLNMKSLLG